MHLLQFIYLIFIKQPLTKNSVDTFGGLGATLVDSLDTLLIMGLDEQFLRARERVYVFFPSLFSPCLLVYMYLFHLLLLSRLLSDFSIWGCI